MSLPERCGTNVVVSPLEWMAFQRHRSWAPLRGAEVPPAVLEVAKPIVKLRSRQAHEERARSGFFLGKTIHVCVSLASRISCEVCPPICSLYDVSSIACIYSQSPHGLIPRPRRSTI